LAANEPAADCQSPDRRRLQTGQVTARAVANDEAHLAFANAASFFVAALGSLGRDVPIGERLSLPFHSKLRLDQ